MTQFRTGVVSVAYENDIDAELKTLEHLGYIVSHEIGNNEVLIRSITRNETFCRGDHSNKSAGDPSPAKPKES
jgi:hypothetical protein